MHLVTYLNLLQAGETTLGTSFDVVCKGHAADADVHWTTARFAGQCTDHARALTPILTRLEAAQEPPQTAAHVDWLRMRRKSAAPQTLLVATSG